MSCKSLNYSGRAVKSPFVNLEEKIEKVVGRRLKSPDSFAAGMRLQALALELHRSFGHHWARRGVYRFKTHEEANQWMLKMLARSDLPRT